MLKDLNWRPLDQRRIDSRLVLMYKVTYDLVGIPDLGYLVHNTRQSSITIRWHTGRYQLLETITNTHSSHEPLFIGMPYQPTYQSYPPWHSSVQLYVRWSTYPLKHQYSVFIVTCRALP